MAGFGTDLKQETKKGKLYRKVGFDFFRGEESTYCFSTEASEKLIAQGDFAIVIEHGEYIGMYDSKDADAGKYFGYDEFRVSISTKELIEKIEAIVVPDWWNEDIDEELHGTDQDPMEWIENLSEYGQVIFESEAKEYNINFNF